jgi:hypothetical protein
METKTMSPTDTAVALELQQPVAFSIVEFCHAHKISVSFYYQLRNQGLGPKEMQLGSRRVISAEAAADWRRARAEQSA